MASYAVLYRTASNAAILNKETYRSIDDAEEGVYDSMEWLKGDWVRSSNSSRLDLSDGSYFLIYQES
jgi:hypothetical protein